VPLAFWNAIDRAGRLHLLPRPDGIAFLQQLGERGARALGQLILKLLRQIGEGHIGVNRLHIA
jgi:hypothetical protein